MRISKHLRTHITLVVITCFLGFGIILGALSIYHSFGLIKAESEGKLMNLVRSHAKELDRDFVEKRILAEETQNYIQVTFNPKELDENPNYMNEYEEGIKPFIYKMAEKYRTAWVFFNHELDGEGHDVWFYDENGDGIPKRMEEQDASYYDDERNKEWFFTPKHEKKAFWSNPYPTTILEDKSVNWISHSIPIYMDDLFIGIVGNDFLYSDFLKKFEEISIYGSGYGILLNDRYQILIHPDYNEIVGLDYIEKFKYQWITEHMSENETGILEYTWTDEDKKVLAYTHLDNGWILGITASKSVIYETLMRQIRYLTFVIGVGILIAAGIVYNLTSRLTRRLEDVTHIISVTGNGDYDTPIPGDYLKDESEIGILARAVEFMRLQQKRSFNEIKQYNEQLEMLVEQRTEELEHANIELENSLTDLKISQKNLIEAKKYEAINRFLIEIAHRMNTPLGNAGMTISYMDHIIDDIAEQTYDHKNTKLSEEMLSLRESVRIISRGVHSSSEIIKSLQVISKDLESAESDQVNIKELIEVCFVEFKSRLQDSESIELNLECPDILKLETYPVLLMEAFTNLFKYTVLYSRKERAKNRVEIKVEKVGSQILIEYCDHSDLSYMEMKDRIFEPFSIASFNTGSGGMEMHMLFNLIKIGLKGDIECLEEKEGGPYYRITINE